MCLYVLQFIFVHAETKKMYELCLKYIIINTYFIAPGLLRRAYCAGLIAPGLLRRAYCAELIAPATLWCKPDNTGF
jgi:hypothetical protein